MSISLTWGMRLYLLWQGVSCCCRRCYRYLASRSLFLSCSAHNLAVGVKGAGRSLCRAHELYRYLLSLLGFNIARHTLELYFGQPWR